MITIGNRRLISSHSLLIPARESASIDVDVDGWKVTVKIEFDDDSNEQGVEIKPFHQNGGILVFKKWTSPLGQALKEPFELATLTGGAKLMFIASNYKIVDTNKFDIQFLHVKGFGQ